MMHLQRHKKRNKRTIFITTSLIVVLVVLFAGAHIFFGFFSGVFSSIAGPLWQGEEALLGGGSFNTGLASKKELRQRVEELEKELETLRVSSLSRELLLQENRELKALLNREDTNPETRLGVVLVKPSQTPYDTLIIDLGSEDGIEEGMRVMARSDVVIGVVEAVHKSTSRVRLFSSPGEEVDVVIGQENIQATAKGRGGGNFVVELPQGVAIDEGDTISFPSITPQVIGVVEVIQTQPSSSFQSILFKSPVNIHQLKWVEVLTK